MKAAWVDGEPANLEAAAADALEWLHLLHERGVVQAVWPHALDKPGVEARLGNCIQALRTWVDPALLDPETE